MIISGKNDNNNPITINGENVVIYERDIVREPSIKDIKALFQCIKIIKKEKPDIIHCHSAKAGFVGRIAGCICGIPTLYTPHAFSFLSSTSKVKKALFIFLEKFARLNSYMVACSESEQKIGTDMIGYKKEKALLWTNSVPDINIEGVCADVKNDFLTVCHVGRPCYQKNILFMVDVAKDVLAKNPNIRFNFYGVGHYSPDLEAAKNLIKKYSLEESISIVDWLPQNDLFDFVRQSDIYISSAIYEGLPLSILEAMALGKPIIASDVVGNNDCVSNDQNGYLIPLDKDLFVEKILSLDNDKSKLLQMGNKSRELFLEHFHIDTQIDKLKQIYENIANKQH